MLDLAILAVTAVVTLALVIAEYRSGVRGTDWRNNLFAWAMRVGSSLLFIPLIPLWQGHALIDGRALPFWWALPIYVVVQDAGEYLFHRAQHRIPALWAMHALHHSDPAMSALTTNRHFWGDALIKSVTVWFVAALIISPTLPLILSYAALSLWNFFVHSALRVDFGHWSWLLNSPAYHRRHHSSLPEHYDSNFAALLPIFDVLAGSYHRPTGFPPTGLDTRPESVADLALWPLVFSGVLRRGSQTPATALDTPSAGSAAP